MKRIPTLPTCAKTGNVERIGNRRQPSLKEAESAATLASGGRPMLKAAIKVGPADHGRKMSLADFDHAEVQEGYLYELGRGVIVVSDVPKKRHLYQVNEIRDQFTAYKFGHAGRIQIIASGSEC